MLLMNGMGWSEAVTMVLPLKTPQYKGFVGLIEKLRTYRQRYLPNAVLNRAQRF